MPSLVERPKRRKTMIIIHIIHTIHEEIKMKCEKCDIEYSIHYNVNNGKNYGVCDICGYVTQDGR